MLNPEVLKCHEDLITLENQNGPSVASKGRGAFKI